MSVVSFRSREVHPRHPPRAVPLGLLAPRCFGALHSSLRSGRASVWGEEGVPLPSVGLLLVPSESSLAQPLSSFSSPSLWFEILEFSCFVRAGARPLSHGRSQ